MGKARLEFNFYPEDDEYHGIVETSIEVDEDADVGEMFNIWKRQMSALGYFMDSYEIIRDEEEYPPVRIRSEADLVNAIFGRQMPMDNPMPPDEEYLTEDESPETVDTATGDSPMKDNSVNIEN